MSPKASTDPRAALERGISEVLESSTSLSLDSAEDRAVLKEKLCLALQPFVAFMERVRDAVKVEATRREESRLAYEAAAGLKPLPAVGAVFTWTWGKRTSTFERLPDAPDPHSTMVMRVRVVSVVEEARPMPLRPYEFHVEPEWFRQRGYRGEADPEVDR